MWWIASLMAFALIGLIALQIKWIRHDFAIREEKFGQQVVTALNEAISKLEIRESVHMIARSDNSALLEDSVRLFFTEPSLPPFPEPFPVAVPEVPETPDIPDSVDFTGVNSYAFITDDDDTMVHVISHYTNKNGKVAVKVDRKKNATEVTTINVPDAELKMKELERKSYELEKQNHELQRKTAELSARQHEQMRLIDQQRLKELERIQKAAEKNQERVQLKAQKLSKVFEKMAFEYNIRTANVMERISPSLIDSVVGMELKNNGVVLPYSISILSGVNDSIVWNRKDSISQAVPDKEYSALLFPGDIINRNDLIKIGFTDTFRYFVSSMWIMLLSSAVFTLVVIFSFVYTLQIILRQKKLSEIKNDFINNMTHEFKTPIATIRLATEAISNPEIVNDAEKVRYYTKIISDENNRMNSHVENILQIAQFDKKSFAQDLVKTDMHQVIADAMEMMKLQTQQHNGVITFKPDAAASFINADRNFISMAIMNLIDNALKYTDGTPLIEITTANQEDQLVITVTDNGIGMKPETSKLIFEKFYRVPSGNLHNVKGFGLGLSYVKAIVTGHEGTISATSELGKGSTFIITLPLIKD